MDFSKLIQDIFSNQFVVILAAVAVAIIFIVVFFAIRSKKNKRYQELLQNQGKYDSVRESKNYAPQLLEAVNENGVRSVKQLSELLRIDRDNVIRIIKIQINKGQIKNLELDIAQTTLIVPKFKDLSRLPRAKVCEQCGTNTFVTENVTTCARCGGHLINKE